MSHWDGGEINIFIPTGHRTAGGCGPVSTLARIHIAHLLGLVQCDVPIFHVTFLKLYASVNYKIINWDPLMGYLFFSISLSNYISSDLLNNFLRGIQGYVTAYPALQVR